MPENMGFQRKGLMDLLPEEIVEADRTAIKKHMQNEALGMREWTCAECGKVFVGHKEHRYRIEKKGRILMFCSHHCMRPTEKEEEERWRRQILGAWVVGDNRVKTPIEIAKENVNRCRTGLRKAEQKAQSTQWGTLTTEQRYKLNRRIADWRAKLLLAEMELEELKANEKD